jgi:hypothetical protein
LIRVREPAPTTKTIPVLFATAAALSMTDEASIAVMGLVLGAMWLFQPRLIHPSRVRGFFVLVALGATIVAVNVFLHGGLTEKNGPGGLEFVGPRMPGFWEGPMPLALPQGPKLLAQDLLLPAGVWAGGLVAAFSAPSARTRILFAFYTLLLFVSFFCFLFIELHKSPMEGHRFVTAAFLFSPLFGALFLGSLRAPQVGAEIRALGGFLIVGANALSVATGLQWIASVAPRVCETHSVMLGAGDLYAADCRKQTGATFMGRPAPTYLESSIWYLYAGCRPVFTPGKIDPTWGMGVTEPIVDANAFSEIDAKIAKAGEPIVVACDRHRLSGSDRVCALAEKSGLCSPLSKDVTECTVPADSRATILGEVAGK